MRKLKEQILELNSQGKSLCFIAKKLNCSKSAVAYHVSHGQKEKSRQRVCKNRKISLLTIISRKIDNFKSRKECSNYQSPGTYTAEKIIYKKIHDFTEGKMTFNSQDIINKFGNNPKCYLTGRPINLLEPRTYHFDHIEPKSKNGSNELSNLGIACKEANQSKHNLELPEFLNLCKEILSNFGYKIQQPISEIDYCI